MTMATAPHLSAVCIYPVKGGRAVSLTESRVEPWGLAGDRRWLVVDGAGRFLSQRSDPALTQLTARYGPAGLVVSAPGRPPLTIPAPSPGRPPPAIPAPSPGGPPTAIPAPPPGRDAEMLRVSVWRAKVWAAAAGAAADAWFSGLLGRPVRLVYLDDPSRRPVDPEFGAPGDRVSFADSHPLLLTTAGSLQALNGWLARDGHPPVPMNRFRPSVVVAGTAPWAEDGWDRIQIGSVSFRVAKPCARCLVTTTDQETGERGRQPLEMLARHRRSGTEVLFGVNLIPDGPGPLRVGDPVQIVERRR
jgi:MOSC domain-containing protein